MPGKYIVVSGSVAEAKSQGLTPKFAGNFAYTDFYFAEGKLYAGSGIRRLLLHHFKILPNGLLDTGSDLRVEISLEEFLASKPVGGWFLQQNADVEVLTCR